MLNSTTVLQPSLEALITSLNWFNRLESVMFFCFNKSKKSNVFTAFRHMLFNQFSKLLSTMKNSAAKETIFILQQNVKIFTTSQIDCKIWQRSSRSMRGNKCGSLLSETTECHRMSKLSLTLSAIYLKLKWATRENTNLQ